MCPRNEGVPPWFEVILVHYNCPPVRGLFSFGTINNGHLIRGGRPARLAPSHRWSCGAAQPPRCRPPRPSRYAAPGRGPFTSWALLPTEPLASRALFPVGPSPHGASHLAGPSPRDEQPPWYAPRWSSLQLVGARYRSSWVSVLAMSRYMQ